MNPYPPPPGMMHQPYQYTHTYAPPPQLSSSSLAPRSVPTKLFFASVPWTTKLETIRSLFGRFGDMVECKLIMDRDDPSKCKGYGFVMYRNYESARAAVEAMNGYRIEDREMKVDFSQPSSSTGGASGGRDGNAGGNRTAQQSNTKSQTNQPPPPTQMLNPIALAILAKYSAKNMRPPLPVEDEFPPFPSEPCPYSNDEMSMMISTSNDMKSNENEIYYEDDDDDNNHEYDSNEEDHEGMDDHSFKRKRNEMDSSAKDAKSIDTNTRVYVSGLPLDVTVEEIQALFGKVGVIAKQKQKRGFPDQWPYKIQIYTDEKTGAQKGDAKIAYEDPSAARTAPQFFDGYELRGHKLKVEMATQTEWQPPQKYGRGSNYDRR